MTKKEKLENLRKFHNLKFKQLGIKDPLFIPKMAFNHSDFSVKIIGLFESEIETSLKLKKPIFIEFINRDYEPETNSRSLYSFELEPDYKTKYKKLELKSGYEVYAIPITNLKEINVFNKDELYEKSYLEQPLTEIKIKDFIAISLKQPISNNKIINDLILKSKKNE